MTDTKIRADPALDVVGAESDDELIAKYIVRYPHGYGPDRAKTVFGVSVHVIVRYLQGEGMIVADVADAYDLPEVAIRAALAYYRQNQALIDARILIDDADSE